MRPIFDARSRFPKMRETIHGCVSPKTRANRPAFGVFHQSTTLITTTNYTGLFLRDSCCEESVLVKKVLPLGKSGPIRKSSTRVISTILCATCALYTWRKNEYSTLAGPIYGGKPHDGNRYRTRGKRIHGIQRNQVRAA